jgi:16S rRNA (guanine966-N2)-methyltransferase
MDASAVSEVLAGAVANGWLAGEAVVVVERGTRDPDWVWPAGIAEDRSRAYGEATLWYGRAAVAQEAATPEPRS